MNPGIHRLKRNTCYVSFCPNVFHEYFVSIIHETFILEKNLFFPLRDMPRLANLRNDVRNFSDYYLRFSEFALNSNALKIFYNYL